MTNVWRVLVIDEDMGVHAEVGRALRAVKVTDIQSATSTQQALSMLSQFRANLIILDIQIRVTAGLTFLRMLPAGQTEADKHMPVVVIARNMDQELGQKSCDSGIHNFIHKPLVAENL
jgi:two-component system chemotaxis response regulator CheY